MSACFRPQRIHESKNSSAHVELPPEIIRRARVPMERMLEFSFLR